MRIKFRVALPTAILLVLCLTPSLMAGGWASVTIEELPTEVQAGKEATIVFKVWQHSNKPVHFLLLDGGRQVPVEPAFKALHLASGKTIEWQAERGKEQGVFSATGIFPQEGIWEWEIDPRPLQGVTPAVTLSVAPAQQVNSVAKLPAISVQPAVILFVPLAAVIGFIYLAVRTSRRRGNDQFSRQTK